MVPPTLPVEPPIGPAETVVYPPRRRRRRRSFGILGALIVIWLILLAISAIVHSGLNSVAASTANREKLTGTVFQNDCVIDELGWFENVPNVEKRLQMFYEKTGVQPYVVLLAYNPELTTDDEKADYAYEYYDQMLDNENTLLYMYFAEENADEDVGYMQLVNGAAVHSVMDAEATQIFWNYLDKYWVDGSLSMDDVIVKTFDSTAERIMTQTTTGADVLKTLVMVIGIMIVIFGVYTVLKLKFERDKEKAEERERILSTPLDKMKTDTDDLINEYAKKDEED